MADIRLDVSHWWLDVDGWIFDPTASQFENPQRWYDRGKGKGFLTREPSKRAQVVLDRIEVRLREMLGMDA